MATDKAVRTGFLMIVLLDSLSAAQNAEWWMRFQLIAIVVILVLGAAALLLLLAETVMDWYEHWRNR